MRRFSILFATILPSLVVMILLLDVTLRREHVRRSEESVLDAKLATCEQSLRRLGGDIDTLHLQLDARQQQLQIQHQQQQSEQEAMRIQLENVRTELLKANQHVLVLQAELDRVRTAAPQATSPAPLHAATH